MASLRIIGAILVAVGAAALAGCGSGPPTGDVSGAASFEGVPIEEGVINFYPADGKGPTAGGKIVDGKYSVEKVPAGTAKVQISNSKDTGKKKKMYDTPESPEYPIKINTMPEKYSDSLKTELRFDVQPGQNVKDWDLKK